MRRPGVWWRGKSTPAKVETYTRWSFHFVAVVTIAGVGLPAVGQVGARFVVPVLLAVCGHGVFCALTASRVLDWTRGNRELPVRLLWALGGVTALLGVAALVLFEHGGNGSGTESGAAMLSVTVPSYGFGTIALAVRDRRRTLVMAAGVATGVAGVGLLVGLPAAAALGTAGVTLITTALFAGTSHLSVWLLDTVYTLDEARETRARLAVAEERLRFGRDLHDVMGRNLAVIALKSELAVQLARRGRPEAVEQMIEVQRIAQESQREVREVVRGYREADLSNELAGAQGVLTAAGIECEIRGSATGLPAQVQPPLGWVVREATTNVLRHGNAERCTVSLLVADGQVTLTVENDGVTEDRSDSTLRRGSGLVGLRERLTEVGGVLRAGPADGGVFRLTAVVPLPAPVPSVPVASVPVPSVPVPSVPVPAVPVPSVPDASERDAASRRPASPAPYPAPHRDADADPDPVSGVTS
ncbi:sensor histidine kinase [Streptomyces sp. NPDC050535]|uniref:sensor histidine kinase n=1 Tax=Streptomyces sp. NPDC050535 TaxID=3365626 RepID=UPI0037BA4C0B